jgi:hypothetical protein
MRVIVPNGVEGSVKGTVVSRVTLTWSRKLWVQTDEEWFEIVKRVEERHRHIDDVVFTETHDKLTVSYTILVDKWTVDFDDLLLWLKNHPRFLIEWNESLGMFEINQNDD